MNNTRSRQRVLTLFATACLASACASGPPPGPSPESIAGANAKVILVAPFNIVTSLPPELEGSTRMVSDALIAHLEAHGKTAHLISFRVGRELWAASMKEVRESGEKRNFENAAKVYAQKIGAQIDFDAMIVPSLFIQNAKTRGRTARWDNTEQRLEITGSMAKNRVNRYQGQIGSISVKAASIFVHILGPEGTKIQTKRAGLEVIEHLSWLVDSARGSLSEDRLLGQELVKDDPPIEDEEMVRAGVAAALSPFLPEEVPLASAPSESSDSPTE